MLVRRLFLSGCLAWFTAFTAGTVSAGEYLGGWQSQFPELKYGVVSVETSVEVMKSQKKFIEYASKELGVKFKLFTAAEYAGVMNAFAAGQLQMSWFGGSPYASTWLDCQCVEPIVGATDPFGAMGYNSVLIVRSDSPYKTYQDLKGKTVARNDPHSTSGYLIPTMSWSGMGTPIDKYFNSPLSGGHQQTIVGVLNGTFDGGFTWTTRGDNIGAIRKMVDKGLLKRDQIRVIWTSPVIPAVAVVVHKSLPPNMKADLIKFFLRLAKNAPALAEVVAQGKTLGFRRMYHEDYVPIIKAKQWLKAQRKKKG